MTTTKTKRTVPELGLTVYSFANIDKEIDRHLSLTPDRHPPYYGHVWPSGIALATELLKRHPDLGGVRLLEIGCGTALSSLVAARQGAIVTAMDSFPEVGEFLNLNCIENKIPEIRFISANWMIEKHALFDETFELVLASDVLYEPDQPLALANFFRRFKKPPRQIYLTDPGRTYLQNFATAMEKLGYRYDIVALEGDIIFLEFVREKS